MFRPRFSIGFGIYAGYPVPYTYSYPYPIPVYGYGAPRAEVMITPGTSAYGGVALEITPYDADVFVDGQYAGKVQDFDGTTQPLTLTAGTHRIEVQAPGYEPMTVDVGIQAGQVIPYRGDLQQVLNGTGTGRLGARSLTQELGALTADMFRPNANPDQPRRYTAEHREPPQQLQRKRKLLRSFSAQRRSNHPLLRQHLHPLNNPRRPLSSLLDAREVGI